MKTVFTSNEIAHIWAHKSAPSGKSPGAVSFDGDVIYSYRTAMARHVEHKGQSAIILNVTSYSVSTSKHQGRINMALPSGIPVFRVDGQDYESQLHFGASGVTLFEHFIQKAAQCLKDSQQPRIRPHTVEAHKGRAAHNLEQAKAVAAFYGLRKKVDEKAIERLATAKARAEKRERIAREAKAMRDKINQQLAYDHWLNNEPNEYFCASLFPVAFRVEGDELVSTLGARVPLQAARVAYRFAMQVRATKGKEGWRENGETCPVGHYRLNAINEHGIVAGCHRIAWAELERLASILA